MVKINGEFQEFDGLTLAQCLEFLGFEERFVAVEINKKIVPRRFWGEMTLGGGDVVEIVKFMGGG